MSMVISSSQITGTNHGMHAIWPFPSGATLLSTLLHALTMKGKRKGSSCNLPTEVCTRVSLLLLLLLVVVVVAIHLFCLLWSQGGNRTVVRAKPSHQSLARIMDPLRSRNAVFIYT
jgi:hypothetical protein